MQLIDLALAAIGSAIIDGISEVHYTLDCLSSPDRMFKIVDRALEVRLGGKRKSKDPSQAYRHRLRAPRQILDFIESSRLPSRTRLETRRLFLVCVCAAFESFWRDAIRIMVKSIGISEALKRSLAKQSFSLAELGDVFGRKLTIPELVACSYTFQHPDVVNKALSDVLSIDAFAEFKKAKFEIVEVPRKNRKPGKPLSRTNVTGEFALKGLNLIERCFSIRHETVHHVGHKHQPSARDVNLMENAVWTFNEFFWMFASNRGRDVRRQSNNRLQPTRGQKAARG